MARTKGSRKSRRASSELLDEAGSGVSGRASERGNKRSPPVKANKGTKGRAIEDTKAAGSVGAKAKVSDGDTTRGTKQIRHRSDDKGRKPNTGAERKDSNSRRSAKELGIEWIGDYCPDGRPHFLIATHAFDGGSLFKCSNCLKHVWLPTYTKDAAEFDIWCDNYGAQTAYCKLLDKNPSARMMVIKLQDLWYSSKNASDLVEFAKLVVDTMEDKDYDRVRRL